MPCSHPKAQKAPDISIFDTMYGAFLRSNRGPLFHCTYDRFTHGESLEGFKDVLRKSPRPPRSAWLEGGPQSPFAKGGRFGMARLIEMLLRSFYIKY